MSFKIKEEMVKKKIKYDYHCDSCDVALVPVFDVSNSFTDQLEYALNIKLEGGYGMYYDAADVEANLCGRCADKLLEAFPFLQNLIANAEDL